MRNPSKVLERSYCILFGIRLSSMIFTGMFLITGTLLDQGMLIHSEFFEKYHKKVEKIATVSCFVLQ